MERVGLDSQSGKYRGTTSRFDCLCSDKRKVVGYGQMDKKEVTRRRINRTWPFRVRTCRHRNLVQNLARERYSCVYNLKWQKREIHAQSVYQWYEPAYDRTTIRINAYILEKFHRKIRTISPTIKYSIERGRKKIKISFISTPLCSSIHEASNQQRAIVQHV